MQVSGGISSRERGPRLKSESEPLQHPVNAMSLYDKEVGTYGCKQRVFIFVGISAPAVAIGRVAADVCLEPRANASLLAVESAWWGRSDDVGLGGRDERDCQGKDGGDAGRHGCEIV